jgi:hypothetical protein
MGKIKIYHGTRYLAKILEHKEVRSPYAIWQADSFNDNVKHYNAFVEKFAEIVKKKEREMGSDFPRQPGFEDANNLDEALADLAVIDPHLFGIDSDENRKFKDIRRGIHVFLGGYGYVDSDATGEDRAIVEFYLPEEILREGLSGNLTLVRRVISLEHARSFYVDKPRIDEVSKKLEEIGHVMPVYLLSLM